MSRTKRLLSALMAALMLLSLPITVGLSRAIADSEKTDLETTEFVPPDEEGVVYTVLSGGSATAYTNGNGSVGLEANLHMNGATMTVLPKDGYYYDRIEVYVSRDGGYREIDPSIIKWNEDEKSFMVTDFDFIIMVYFEKKQTGLTEMLDKSITGYEGVYDAQPHGITVDMDALPEGTVIYYNAAEVKGWTTEAPTITNVAEGPLTVQVKAENPNYEDAYAEATITILPRPVTVNVVLSHYETEYTGETVSYRATITYMPQEDEILAATEGYDPHYGGGKNDYFVKRSEVGITYTQVDPEMFHLTDENNGMSAEMLQNFDPTFNVEQGWLEITKISSDELTELLENSITGYEGVYDAQPHGITVDMDALPEGTVIYYNAAEVKGWTTEAPTITNVAEGPLTVQVKAENPNYEDAYAEATITILPRPVTVNVVLSHYETEYTGETVSYRATITYMPQEDEILAATEGYDPHYGGGKNDYFVKRSEVGITYTQVDPEMFLLTDQMNGMSAEMLANFDPTFNVEQGWLEIIAGPMFKTHLLVLSGQIGLKFHMDLEALTEEEKADSYMTFAITGKGARFINERDDFDANDRNGAGYYAFTCLVSPIQMADIVTATYHYGDGLTIEETYSIRQYVEAYEANKDLFNEKTQNLIEALADYGHYTQPFLAMENHWTVGTDYAEMDKYFTESYDIDTVKSEVESYAFVKTNKTKGDITNITQSLSLAEAPIINVYFAPAKDYEGSFTVTLGGNALETEQLSDGRYRVQITGISAHLLGKTYTLKVTTDNGTATVKVSALSYVQGILNSETYASNEVACNAAASIYCYYKAAYAYKYGN